MEVAHDAILSNPTKDHNNCSQLLNRVKVIPRGAGSKPHTIHPEFHTMG
jgi:hypothetical protein